MTVCYNDGGVLARRPLFDALRFGAGHYFLRFQKFFRDSHCYKYLHMLKCICRKESERGTEMTEVFFEDIGYLCKSEVEAVKNALEGKTYMHFKISAGICGGGNYRLIVRTEHEDTTEEELRGSFTRALVTEIWEASRRNK